MLTALAFSDDDEPFTRFGTHPFGAGGGGGAGTAGAFPASALPTTVYITIGRGGTGAEL